LLFDIYFGGRLFLNTRPSLTRPVSSVSSPACTFHSLEQEKKTFKVEIEGPLESRNSRIFVLTLIFGVAHSVLHFEKSLVKLLALVGVPVVPRGRTFDQGLCEDSLSLPA
jgi:hypothetical protein